MYSKQALMAADPFYGPIVAKIDSILQQYSGFLDDNCKEWLICNMYKDPTRYSPHSNFLSAELSRYDTLNLMVCYSFTRQLWLISLFTVAHSDQGLIGASKTGNVECSRSHIL